MGGEANEILVGTAGLESYVTGFGRGSARRAAGCFSVVVAVTVREDERLRYDGTCGSGLIGRGGLVRGGDGEDDRVVLDGLAALGAGRSMGGGWGGEVGTSGLDFGVR